MTRATAAANEAKRVKAETEKLDKAQAEFDKLNERAKKFAADKKKFND